MQAPKPSVCCSSYEVPEVQPLHCTGEDFKVDTILSGGLRSSWPRQREAEPC